MTRVLVIDMPFDDGLIYYYLFCWLYIFLNNSFVANNEWKNFNTNIVLEIFSSSWNSTLELNVLNKFSYINF